MSKPNAWRLHQAELGLAQARGEFERAWWAERVAFLREAIRREGADTATSTENWRHRLAEWRGEVKP